MARGLLSHLIQDQAGNIQPYTSALVLELDRVTPLHQVLYANPTGPDALANPLQSDALGYLLAYADIAQRAVVRVGSGASAAYTVVDIEDDPADMQSAPIALAALAPGATGLLRSNGTVVTAGHTVADADVAVGAAIAITKLQAVTANAVVRGDGTGALGAALLVNANIDPTTEIDVLKLSHGTAYQALITNAAGTDLSWATSLQGLMTATGDLLYASSANTPARRGIGATDAVFLVAGGVPTWGTVNTAGITANAVTQTFSAIGATVGPTTASGVAADLAEMTSGTFTTTGGKVIVTFNGTFQNTGAGNALLIDLLLDGALQLRRSVDAPAANKNFIVSFGHILTMALGAHTLKIQWSVGAGTATAVGTERAWSGVEMKR